MHALGRIDSGDRTLVQIVDAAMAEAARFSPPPGCRPALPETRETARPAGTKSPAPPSTRRQAPATSTRRARSPLAPSDRRCRCIRKSLESALLEELQRTTGAGGETIVAFALAG